MSPRIQLAVLCGLAAILIVVAVWIILRVTKPGPEKRERRRREYVNRFGRLGDALITEVTENVIYYNYSVHGVEYSASQDISMLQEFLPKDGGSLVGIANLKYASKNPANSILICEEWSGIRPRAARPAPDGPQAAAPRPASSST